MAEIVGLVASILQLVDVVVKARSYIKDFSNAPKDQRLLLEEIQTLDTLLKKLDNRIQTTVVPSAMREVLVQLQRTMMRLKKKLDSHGFSTRLTWPLWGKEDVREGLDTIERFKSSVNIHLGMDIWNSAQEISGSIKLSAQEQTKHHADMIAAVRKEAEEQRMAQNESLKLVRNVARNQEQHRNSDYRDKVIEWFSPLNFFRRQAEVLGNRQAGTGEWLLETNIFKQWESGTFKTLWCYGIPGAGKTVLASIVIEHLQKNLESESIGVAVIYLNHKETEIQSPQNLLAALWQQLIFGKPISQTVAALYERHREQRTRPSLADAEAILSPTVRQLTRVFIVVDALDEYPGEQHNDLLQSISRLGPTVSLMLMSRPHINIVPNPALMTLEIRATADDIRQYIKAQIVKSSRLWKHVQNSDGLQGEIERIIIQRSDGMFLVAKLHIDSLTRKLTVKAVRETLKKMPGTLNATYDEVMERINGQSEEERNLARRILCWIQKTEMTLHISALREALAIEPGTVDLDPDNLLNMETILSVCAGLVITDEEDMVRLIHYTAEEYLDEIQEREFPHAHTEIAKACITYLSFRKFTETQPRVTQTTLETLIKENALLEYALLFALDHARGEPESSIKRDILQFLTRLSVEWEHLWGIMHDLHISLPRTRLGISAYFGMLEVTRHLLKEDGFDIGALRGAAFTGYTDMVHLLMTSDGYNDFVKQRKASSEGHDSNFESATALQSAAFHGEEELVYRLLEHGAEVNMETEMYGTALQAASVNGHYAVVCILLANGADVNSQSALYGTALRAASLEGHMDTVLLLIENGARINAQGGKHGTALTAGLSCGHEHVAHLLLEHGANVNDHGAGGWTVLGLAAGNGHQEIVRLLIQQGANINERSGANNTALQAASSGGHNEIVLLLIEKGADVNEEGGEHGTALQMASRLGKLEVVRTLIKNGAKINAKGGKHGTALQAASSRGHEAVVRLLIQSGATVNAEGQR